MLTSQNPPIPILSLGEAFYSPVRAAQFPKIQPRYLNKNAALCVGLKLEDDSAWIRHFANFHPLPNNLMQPLALAYHGHQFRHYNPDLGDGRGFLYAQLQSRQEFPPRWLDLGTKGSGQTPYSRGGDGRLTLKGAVREALATEQLESLGVNTSKTFAIFETGEALSRNDEPSPTRSAVLTRLSHGHIRFGSFQRLAYLKQVENIHSLLVYCIQLYFPELTPQALPTTVPDAHSAELFLIEVIRRSAKLCAQWMIAGFVHGVLNTDNMNITGESFDYGPYRFLPNFDPQFTAAYFDQQGLYSYGNQPNAVYWNLKQFALALRYAYPTLDVEKCLAAFGEVFRQAVKTYFLQRLNITAKADTDLHKQDELLTSFFKALESSGLDFAQVFYDFHSGHQPGEKKQRWELSKNASTYSSPEFTKLTKELENFVTKCTTLQNHAYFQLREPCTLLIDEIEAIWQPIASTDNWDLFNQKISQIRLFRSATTKFDF